MVAHVLKWEDSSFLPSKSKFSTVGGQSTLKLREPAVECSKAGIYMDAINTLAAEKKLHLSSNYSSKSA